jgi:hypothetical protein
MTKVQTCIRVVLAALLDLSTLFAALAAFLASLRAALASRRCRAVGGLVLKAGSVRFSKVPRLRVDNRIFVVRRSSIVVAGATTSTVAKTTKPAAEQCICISLRVTFQLVSAHVATTYVLLETLQDCIFSIID